MGAPARMLCSTQWFPGSLVSGLAPGAVNGDDRYASTLGAAGDFKRGGLVAFVQGLHEPGQAQSCGCADGKIHVAWIFLIQPCRCLLSWFLAK